MSIEERARELLKAIERNEFDWRIMLIDRAPQIIESLLTQLSTLESENARLRERLWKALDFLPINKANEYARTILLDTLEATREAEL